MSYPSPNDPEYCPGSLSTIVDYDNVVFGPDGRQVEPEWFKCPHCGRWLHERGKTKTFWPHIKRSRRSRVSDRVRDGLVSFGMNRKDPPVHFEYAEAET